MNERNFALDVVSRLRAAGHQALWAGGCVRDQLLGLEPTDYDVATDALPDEVTRLFRRTITVGASFGVVEVLGSSPDLRVQVATFRSDGTYSDGRHPDQVHYSSPEEDARRRDFTINGLFFDPIEERLIDFVGGRADLEAKVLRAIGDPRQRIVEDKLRMLRGIRFAVRFNLALEPETRTAIHDMAGEVTVVSAERIADELRKLLALPGRARGIALLRDLGLLEVLFPELREFPDADWASILQALEYLGESPTFTTAFSCLLIGAGPGIPAGSQKVIEQRSNLKGAAATWTYEICRRLRLSVAEQDRIAWLVASRGILDHAKELPLRDLKRLLAHPGILALLAVRRAVCLASGQALDQIEYCERRLREWSPQAINPLPLVTGDDLKVLRLPAGPVYKQLLVEVRNAQLDGTISTREEAMTLLRALVEKRPH